MHLEQTPDTLLPALDRVVHGIAGGKHAGINADIRERTDERVGRDLEGERGERLVVRGVTLGLGAGLVVEMALDGRAIDRRGQKIDHGVERGLHALVLEGAAAQHRHDIELEVALAQTLHDLALGQLLAS